MNKPLLWLRAEYKAFEERTLLTPSVARQLVEAGHEVVVERSESRCFADEDYASAGCRLADAGDWQNADEQAIILGLKELDPELGPFTRRHVHFAHAYKQQRGWQQCLQAFTKGGGSLYDLEYLVDEQGRRVAAFGYWAGYVGAAMGVLTWCGQLLEREPVMGPLQSWSSQAELMAHVRTELQQAVTVAGRKQGSDEATARPSAIVIGALGRCGRGACELLESCDIALTRWDQAETASGGPFDDILAHDLLVNCVFVSTPNPPFTTKAHLQSSQRKLSVIADVSCDPDGDYNPLPIYSKCTTMQKPSSRLLTATGQSPALDLVAIDHLPSLLPAESSEDFSTQLLSSLLELDRIDQGVWQRAKAVFDRVSAEAKAG